MFKANLITRHNFRAQIIQKIIEGREKQSDPGVALLLISESIDDYIEHRIETDKVLEGILKDIQGNIANLSEINIEKLLTGNTN